MTDLVDGWIARRWNLQTVIGTVIDPMADKTLMTILTVCLAVKGALPGTPPLLLAFLAAFELMRNSMAGGNHSWERFGTRHSSHLLPVDLSPSTKDRHPILGFLASVCGSASNYHQ